MKWLRNLLTKSPLRGRVHRMSVTKGGEVSIVVRFGMEESRARQLNQGALLDIVPHTAGKAAAAIVRSDSRGPQ